MQTAYSGLGRRRPNTSGQRTASAEMLPKRNYWRCTAIGMLPHGCFGGPRLQQASRFSPGSSCSVCIARRAIHKFSYSPRNWSGPRWATPGHALATPSRLLSASRVWEAKAPQRQRKDGGWRGWVAAGRLDWTGLAGAGLSRAREQRAPEHSCRVEDERKDAETKSLSV